MAKESWYFFKILRTPLILAISAEILEISCVCKLNFCKELSELNFLSKGNIKVLNDTKMSNGQLVNENLVNLIAKIGEKIDPGSDFFFSGLAFHRI